jgi:hypothetical protein
MRLVPATTNDVESTTHQKSRLPNGDDTTGSVFVKTELKSSTEVYVRKHRLPYTAAVHKVICQLTMNYPTDSALISTETGRVT